MDLASETVKSFLFFDNLTNHISILQNSIFGYGGINSTTSTQHYANFLVDFLVDASNIL